MSKYTDTNADYAKRLQQVVKVRDTLEGLEHIQSKDEIYLPMTAGMKGRDASGARSASNPNLLLGTAQYIEFKSRTFMPDYVQEIQNGVAGLAFAEQVESNIDYALTEDGRNGEELAINMLAEVQQAGTTLLVVDAPIEGGEPFISEYPFESFVDFAVDETNKAKFTALKLAESYYEDDDIYKSNPIPRYREYQITDGVVRVFVRDEEGENIEAPAILPVDEIPVYVSGSIDTMPSYDPVPLLPVARAVLQIYRDSADYGQFKSLYGQGTPYATGITDQAEADNIMLMGFGAGAFWWSTTPEAKFGMIEAGEKSDEIYIRAFDLQKNFAERHAVAITQDTAGVEAASSMKLRAATKHASIYTMLNSISSAVVSATNMKLKWSGNPENAEFQLNTNFDQEEISSQLIAALDRSVTVGNTAISVLNNAQRKAKLTEKTDEELAAEIMDRET